MAIIYSYGESTNITVPAGEKISVYSRSAAKVYQLVGYPNYPSTWNLIATTTAGTEYISSAFASGATLKIEAGIDEVVYEVGAAPTNFDGNIKQGAPTAKTTSATLTIAELMTKILTGTHAAGSTQTYTLPTGTLTDAGVGMVAGEAFDWVLINLSAAAADTITVAAGTDHTIVGNAIVQSAHSTTGALYGNSAQFRTRKTAANTFITYRIA